MRKLLRRLSHGIHFLFGDGTWSLRAHEYRVVEAVVSSLPPDIQMAIRRQLGQAFFVERAQERINVLRYYDQAPELTISDAEFSDSLFKVRMEIDGASQTAHVTFYKGWLFSVEFKKPGKFFLGRSILIREVTKGRPGESFTRAIDRVAHGATGARGDRE